jgi:hypothetical protein
LVQNLVKNVAQPQENEDPNDFFRQHLSENLPAKDPSSRKPGPNPTGFGSDQWDQLQKETKANGVNRNSWGDWDEKASSNNHNNSNNNSNFNNGSNAYSSGKASQGSDSWDDDWDTPKQTKKPAQQQKPESNTWDDWGDSSNKNPSKAVAPKKSDNWDDWNDNNAFNATAAATTSASSTQIGFQAKTHPTKPANDDDWGDDWSGNNKGSNSGTTSSVPAAKTNGASDGGWDDNWNSGSTTVQTSMGGIGSKTSAPTYGSFTSEQPLKQRKGGNVAASFSAPAPAPTATSAPSTTDWKDDGWEDF